MSTSRSLRSGRVETRSRSTNEADLLLAGFDHGSRTITVTKGLCSILDVLDALLRRTGPEVDVDLAIWTVGQEDLATVADWLGRGRMRSLRWLLGASFFERHPDYARYLVETFGREMHG